MIQEGSDQTQSKEAKGQVRMAKINEGWLVSESCYSGFAPQVKYRSVRDSQYKNLLAYDSIFQIVPPTMSMWGKPIDFASKSYTKVSLRHFITGNLLTYSDVGSEKGSVQQQERTKSALQSSEAHKTLQLSPNFIDFAKEWMADPGNAQKIKDIVSKASESEDQEAGNLMQHISEVYFRRHSIRIVKESSIEEEGKGLQSSNLIQFVDKEYNTLDLNPVESITFDHSAKCAYFNNHFYDLTVGELNTHDVVFGSESSQTTFYLQHVDPNLVCKIIYYMKVLEPLVEIMRSNQFTLDMIAEGEFVIRKLTQFLKSGTQQEGAGSARGVKSNHLNKEI